MGGYVRYVEPAHPDGHGTVRPAALNEFKIAATPLCCLVNSGKENALTYPYRWCGVRERWWTMVG